MKEEGLVYDVQTGGFLHLYRDGGKLTIDGQRCEHEHVMPTVILVE